MMLRRKIFVGFAVGLVLLISGCAATSETVDGGKIAEKIVNDLDSSSSFSTVVIDPATISNLDLLKDKDFESYTSLVVLKAKNLGDYLPEDLSDYIVKDNAGDSATGLNFLVVAGKTESHIYVSAVTAELKTKVISILGGVDKSGAVVTNDPGWLILRNADAIKKAQSVYADNSAVVITGIVLGSIFVGIPLLIFIGYLVFRFVDHVRHPNYISIQRKQKRKNARAAAKAKKIDARAAKVKDAAQAKQQREREANAAHVTPPIETYLGVIREAKKNLRATDPALSESLGLVLSRFMELRESFTLMETPEVKRNVLYVEYENRLEQIATLIGPKYYDNLKKNPEYWHDPEAKLNAIRLSVEKTAEQILENIRQLMEGSEFEFDLVVETILGFKVVDPREMLK